MEVESTLTNTVIPGRFSRMIGVIKASGWVFFALGCLISFTLIKLPDSKIKGYVDAMVADQLSRQGISYTARETDLSLGFGISYELRDALIQMQGSSVRVEKIRFSPSLLSLILGRMGGSIRLEQGEGRLKGTFSFKEPEFSVSFDADQLDLGRLGILPMIAGGVEGSVIAAGTGSISGDMANAQTMMGKMDVTLKKLVISQQKIAGFSIPKLTVSEAKLETAIENGKIVMKNVKLGKPGSTDDIIADVTGDIALAKRFDSSTLNLKTKFTFSQNIMKSFVLLDALLGGGKQPDGSYAFGLTGPMNGPTPTPLK